MDSWEWVYELVYKKQELMPELPEDTILYMIKLNPKLQELIDRFDLDLDI